MTKVNIGKGIELEVDFSKFPPAALDHAQSSAVAEKKLAALLSGEVRVSSSREGDPVRAEAVRMATDAVKALLRKSGKKVADYTGASIREAAVTFLGKNPDLLAKAAARVADAKSIDAGDLSDLGL